MSAMAAGLVACGSAPDTSVFDDDQGGDSSVTTDGATSDTSTGGDTTPTPDTGLPPTDTGLLPSDTTPPPTDTTPPPVDTGPGPATLDNVCERLADGVCSSVTKTCCSSRGVTYNETGCRNNVKGYCSGFVAQAKAGTRTFDATKVDACSAAWRSLITACSVPTLTYIKGYAVCDQMFNGPTAPGDGPCTNASDCKSAAGALSGCNSGGDCENYVVVGKDQPCNYDGDTKRFCDYGLYCPFGVFGSKCATAKGLGSGGCFGGSDPSCGWGNRCDPSNHCAAGLPMGTGCSSDQQCSSWTCAGGKCTDPNVEMGIPSICGG